MFSRPRDIIYDVYEKIEKMKISGSKIFSADLLEKDGILEEICISWGFRDSKGFLYKIDETTL